MVRPPHDTWVEVDERVFFKQITSVEEERYPEGGKQHKKDVRIKVCALRPSHHISNCISSYWLPCCCLGYLHRARSKAIHFEMLCGKVFNLRTWNSFVPQFKR